MKLKLLSFNIQHCRNFITRQIDIDSVVNLIKETGADIIGLNEVYGEFDNNKAQYQEISEKLGFYYYFGQTITWKNIPFGNALISKYPLKDPKNIMIPDPEVRDSHWYETRSIIRTNFKDFDLNLLITHYGLFDTEQENALNTTLNLINDIKERIVFMGDLNMEPSNPKIKTLESILVNTHPFEEATYPSNEPIKKIDYIFVSKDLKYKNAKIIKKIVSDHFAHYAEIEI